LAQLVEQRTCNAKVISSNPISGTKSPAGLLWLKATDCKSVLSEYEGSNPSPSTKCIVDG
ncbi:unnamed protein product, partial [Chrysoparadoxa australica]